MCFSRQYAGVHCMLVYREMCFPINADSIHYLSFEGTQVQTTRTNYCVFWKTGSYLVSHVCTNVKKEEKKCDFLMNKTIFFDKLKFIEWHKKV
jgi:hypothetical protein